MSDRLNEALERWEGWELGEPFDAMTLDVLLIAARAYADLVNGERVEPDYEAADAELERFWDSYEYPAHPSATEARAAVYRIVAAAIGDRLLIDPPKEEE